MKEIMEIIYNLLSTKAPTRYQDLDRRDDGSIKLEETSITYDIGNVLNSNEARLDLPLSIDIWYRKSDIYIVEGLIEELGDILTDSMIIGEGSLYLFRRAGHYVISIPDTGKDILRKQMNFNIEVYK